jgi:transposase
MKTRGRPLCKLELTPTEKQALQQTVRRRGAGHLEVLRAKVILWAAAGLSNTEIVWRTHLSAPTVGKWRQRFLQNRTAGLSELPRSGAPRRINDDKIQEVITATLENQPENSTHWSTRTMAQRCGLSRQAVSRIWRAFGLKPHRSETFTLSTDPLFVEKVRDVVGLYMDPPHNALVLCVDEKTQVQALERSQPVLPMRPGRPERRTHDYYRHGTLALFAALNVATGQIISATKPKHRTKEFLNFLRQIEREVPADLDVHIILDNYATHKTEAVEDWLAKRPGWKLHFTPTHSSWLNQVERFFAKITNQRIRRGVFQSVADLAQTIKEYIAHHNKNPRPFRWTASGDLILGKVKTICNELL